MKKPDLVEIEQLEEAARCFKVMSHPIRLRMVDIMMQGEYSVREIADMCGLPHHQCCEHLRMMRGYGFLSSVRKGRRVYYKIVNQRLPRIMKCVRQSCDI